MTYQVIVTREAKSQFLGLSAREQRICAEGIAARLVDQPTASSRAIKLLRPNPFAGYELRLGDLRVLYNVDEQVAEVVVVAIGREVGNTLYIAGEVFHEHESGSPE
jgi:mRNA-degrading endonuclease RelE of RelBE toxin-antitoxin system